MIDQPQWWTPESKNWPMGYPAAMDSTTTVAAPLLGGFSIALIGVVAQASDHFRWPGVTLLLLTLAAIAFISCVQCGFWAKQYLSRPDEVMSWFDQDGLADWERAQLKSRLSQQQSIRAHGHVIWIARTTRCYSLALIFLIAGVAVVLAPTVASPGNEESAFRWVASGVASCYLVFELFWTTANVLLDKPKVMQFGPARRILLGWFRPYTASIERRERNQNS